MPNQKTSVGWIPAHPCYGSVSMLRYWKALESAWRPEDPFDLCPILPDSYTTKEIKHRGQVERMWTRKISYPLTIQTRLKGNIAHVLDQSWADMLPHVSESTPKVVTVHDLIPLRFPGELTPQQIRRFSKVVNHINRQTE